MAGGARSGLKLSAEEVFTFTTSGLNGLGSPFGIETPSDCWALTNKERLNGLGSPFGIETAYGKTDNHGQLPRLNGLGSPFGIETEKFTVFTVNHREAKWPGEPVRD